MARSQSGRRVDWFAAGLGMVLAVVIELVGGTLLFGSHRGQLVSQGLLTFAALLAGGTLAGFIGGGGLGEYVINALAANQMGQLLEGSASVAVLALLADAILAAIERRLAFSDTNPALARI